MIKALRGLGIGLAMEENLPNPREVTDVTKTRVNRSKTMQIR
jgi:hypothetical protein